MLKRFYFLVIFLILSSTCAFAETVVVEALNDFSTVSSQNTLTVRILNNIQLDESLTINSGDILTGKIIDVTQPKRLKRDAKFSFKITDVKDANGSLTHLTNDYVGTYTTKLNKADLAKSAALSVGNHFVKGISIGFYAVEGAVENEEGNRIKSTAKSVYENSPLSYAEKGKNLYIKSGDKFYLKFNTYNQKEN